MITFEGKERPEIDEPGLIVWTLFERPQDYPDKWVVRPSLVRSGRGIQPYDWVVLADTEVELFASNLFTDLHFLVRQTLDDPVIEGVWI